MNETSLDRGQYYERQLSATEVEQRKDLALDLMSERDDILAEIDEKRRQIRALNVSRKKLEVRVAQVRREARSGKALEPRQTELPIVAPEIDPPGPYALFEEMYPLAPESTRLATDLRQALNDVQFRKLEAVGAPHNWHPASGIFNAVANWARIEKAHAEAGKRAPVAGLALPRREPMPEKLREIVEPGAPKKAARKPRSRPA